MRKIVIIVLCVIALSGIVNAMPGFVVVNGTYFTLDGKPFYFAGANSYYLWYGNWNCTSYDTNQGCSKEVLNDAKAMNLTVMRVWGFSDGSNYWGSLQPSAGIYSEASFQKYDRMIKEASDRNIKLIIPFVNNWNNFGGMCQYVMWCNPNITSCSDTSANHDTFYTNACTRDLYKKYIAYFLNRTNTLTGIKYKDDTTIMAWELANEPRAKSDPTQTILDNWIEEMSTYIKSVDSNHIMTVGHEGFTAASEGTDFVRNHDHSSIDFAGFHLLVDNWGFSYQQGIDWINSHMNDAVVLGKPVILEEMGKSEPRDAYFDGFYNLTEARRINGDLFWMLKDANYPDWDGYGIDYPEDSTTARIIRHANFMTAINDTTPANDTPVLSHISDVVAKEGDLISVVATARDGYGDPLTYSITGNKFTQNGNVFTWQTHVGDLGKYNFTLTVTDEKYNVSQRFLVMINGVNNSCLVPYGNMIIYNNITLCNGIYVMEGPVYMSGGSVLDCNGSTLVGNRSMSGIELGASEIKNCRITNYSSGIVGWHDSNNLIENNTITNSNTGIMFHDTKYTTVRNNNINSNAHGIRLWWGTYYNTFENNNLTNNNIGFYFDWIANNNVFRKNILNENTYGFYHDPQWYGTIYNNAIIENEIRNSSSYGIYLGASVGFTVIGNILAENNNGIQLEKSYNNTVIQNTLVENSYGIKMNQCSNNTIYRNNFVNNTYQAYYPASNNSWDYNGEGNYWSNYDEPAEGCVDSNSDGICDSPYTIYLDIKDNYPFINRSGWCSKLKGDVDKNFVVNILDLAKVGICFRQPATGSCINADLNGDGDINIIDLATVGLHFGQSC